MAGERGTVVVKRKKIESIVNHWQRYFVTFRPCYRLSTAAMSLLNCANESVDVARAFFSAPFHRQVVHSNNAADESLRMLRSEDRTMIRRQLFQFPNSRTDRLTSRGYTPASKMCPTNILGRIPRPCKRI